MPVEASAYVFNADALMASALIMIGILVFHAFYMFAASRSYRARATRMIESRRYYAAQLLFVLGALVISFSHIFEILILGYTLNWMGLIQDTHKAIVFAGSTYTTVGFGPDPLPIGWDLVMVTMAMSGLITVAWTTTILFGMATYSQRAHELEMKLKRSRRHGSAHPADDASSEHAP